MSDNDTATSALLEFLNAAEAGITAAKTLIKKHKITNQEQAWNPDNIKWQQAQGPAGPYEKSQDPENPHTKLLIQTLNQHQGKLTKNGHFYWLFKNNTTIGRKKR